MAIGRNKKKEQEVIHHHLWQSGYNDSEQKCGCGEILVSQQEYDRRSAIWLKYYEDVRGTRAYKRYAEQREAFLRNDMATVKRLGLEARSQLTKRVNEDGYEEWYQPVLELEKPHFPDPGSWNHYVVSNPSSPEVIMAEEIFGVKAEPVQENQEIPF